MKTFIWREDNSIIVVLTNKNGNMLKQDALLNINTLNDFIKKWDQTIFPKKNLSKRNQRHKNYLKLWKNLTGSK